MNGLDPTGGFIADYFDDNGNLMAGITSAAVGAARKALFIARRHGGALHQALMGTLAKTIKRAGAALEHIRTNQALINPQTGEVLSRMRPDVQGFIPALKAGMKGTIHIAEACVSQSAAAARQKWADVILKLKRDGYDVIFHIIER